MRSDGLPPDVFIINQDIGKRYTDAAKSGNRRFRAAKIKLLSGIWEKLIFLPLISLKLKCFYG